MKKGDERVIVDHKIEINAMVKYLEETWKGVEQIVDLNDNYAFPDFVAFIYQKAVEDSRSWIDTHEVGFEETHKIEKNREDFLKDKGHEEIYLYDSFYKNISNIYNIFSDIERAFKGYPYWDFSERTQVVLEDAKKYFKNIENEGFRPINFYNKDVDFSCINEEEFKKIKNIKEDIINSFEGHDATPLRGFPFADRVCYSSIKFNEEDQGRKKYESLVSAVYGHALGISENNNTVEVKKIIDEFANQYKLTDINGEKIDLSILNKHPITQLILKIMEYDTKGLEEYYSFDKLMEKRDEIQKNKIEFEKKTEVEKEKIKTKREKEMKKFLDSLFDKIEIKKENKEDEKKEAFIQNEFFKILKKDKQKSKEKKNNLKF